MTHVRHRALVAFVAFIASPAAGCAERGGHDRLLHPGSTELEQRAPEAFRVRLDTTRGPIVLEVQRAWAPHGVDRFHALVRAGYYDDAAVFRVRAGVFAQFGIHGDPAIARRWRTITIPDDPLGQLWSL